jgi:hypothetical protein
MQRYGQREVSEFQGRHCIRQRYIHERYSDQEIHSHWHKDKDVIMSNCSQRPTDNSQWETVN